MNSHSERGGAWLGRSLLFPARGTWPFATLRATRERVDVELGVWPLAWRVVVPAGGVVIVRRRPWLAGGGVQFHSGAAGVPPLVVFWSLRPRRLRAALGRLGYPVSEEVAPNQPPQRAAGV